MAHSRRSWASFNRTLVELKCRNVIGINISMNSFNRTFVELKCVWTVQLIIATLSFNRTLVELKSLNLCQQKTAEQVLIVP